MANADKLSLGLDDIIRNDRSSGRGGKRGMRGRGGAGRGIGRSSGSDNSFRTRGGGIPRASNAPMGRWKHDLYENSGNRGRAGQRPSGVNTPTKLLISNLYSGVTSEDIEELFGEVGAIRAAHVHYDERSRSLGTAEVIYERRADAMTALQKYNGVNLDGAPMEISVVGASVDDRPDKVSRLSYNNGNTGGKPSGGFRNNQQNGNRSGGNRGRGGNSQKSAMNGNSKKEDLTAEDLDAELDAYRAEAAPKK